ncbi:MAG: serine/threonine-protein kinase [Myxococcales bacterium]
MGSTSEWAADELIPFGKYVLLDRLSSGATASVYRASVRGEAGFERVVAVKRILPHMAGDPAFVKTFVAEAKITARLTHANICPIYELGKVGESLYMAVEYVAGKDLGLVRRRLEQKGLTTPPEAAAWIAARLCDALDYAHNLKNMAGERVGIVHRDLSPTNIVISYEGQVKLIDFGLAKAVGRAQQTNVDALKKKLSYMSPEMVKGRAPDARSDVFGVGICLYEMLTGRKLFSGINDIATLTAVGKASVPPPSAVMEDAPEALELILMRALERDPEDRWQSAAEMGEALNAFLAKTAPTYGINQLSAWMHELFGEEIETEQSSFGRLIEASKDPQVLRQRRAFFASPDGAAARVRAEVERRLSARPRASAPKMVRAPGPAPVPAEARPVSERPPTGKGGQFEDAPTAFYGSDGGRQAPFEDEPTQHLADADLLELGAGVVVQGDEFDEEPTEIFFNKEEGIGVRQLLHEINDVEEQPAGGLNRPIVAPDLGQSVPPAAASAPPAPPLSSAPAPAPPRRVPPVRSSAPPINAPPTAATPQPSAPPAPHPSGAPFETPASTPPRGTGNLPLAAAALLLLGVIGVLLFKTPVGVVLGLRSRDAGSLEVRTTPATGAAVKVDGVYRGQEPLRIDGVKAGVRELTLSAEGFTDVAARVDVRPGETSRLQLVMRPENQP